MRLEGYLSNNDFVAALMSGLGRIAFVLKKYADAERCYSDVVAHSGDSHFAPEAMYWRAVAQYGATHDHTVLGKVAEELRSKRLTNTPIRQARSVLKCPDDRKNRVVSAQAT